MAPRQSQAQSRRSWRRTLSTFVATLAVANAAVLPRQVDSTELLKSYDYVIVGGGTAGLTLADRLTEDPETTVLVIEIGDFGDAATILNINANTRPAGPSSPIWPGINSVPDANLGGKVTQVRIGKVVGGGSAVNAMIGMRGSSEDYDRWGALFEDGADGSAWNWDTMLPYFKKGLQLLPPPADLVKQFNISYDESYWGKSATIYGGFPSFHYPGIIPLVNAMKEMPGVEFPVDSGAGSAGVFWNPALMDSRTVTRSYARTGHYSNVQPRSNYHLLINTKVRRLLIDSKSKVASGVEFQSVNSTTLQTITANLETVLSAGSVHDPQLLQLSGVGPKALLESAGIDVIVDLPGVGQNFNDHSNMGNGVNIALAGLSDIHPNPSDLANKNSTFYAWAQELWAANKTGPFTMPFLNIAGWLPLTAVTPKFDELATKLEQSDFASLLPAGTHPTVVAGYAAQMKALAGGMRSKTTGFFRFILQAQSGAQGPVALQSFARGSININTTDPWNTEPIVDYRALSNPVETDIYVEAVHFLRRYSFNTSLAALGPVETVPGPSVVGQDELRAHVAKNLSPTDYHPVGTCAMMPLELGGVVDRNLRVYGVKRLRVVDASIMPMVPGANTCQPTYAVAEKAADILKQTRPKCKRSVAA